MPYSDSAALAADATFRARVEAAITKKALDQLAAPFDQSVRFQKRSALARRILGEDEQVTIGGSQTAPTIRPADVVIEFAEALTAANPTWTVASPPSDTQLNNALTAALVDALAGVTANE